MPVFGGVKLSGDMRGTGGSRRDAALYAVRIEDLGRGDLVKVDCPACHHVALLTPEALLRVGQSPAARCRSRAGTAS